MKYYTMIDIGASSGRIMLAEIDNKQLALQEVHRFKNGFSRIDGSDRWDIETIFEEILTGLSKLKALGVTECHLGIDTWAVDYCLIGTDGQLLQLPISYRDERTKDTMEKVAQEIDKETIYAKTGIQFLNFNTLYQLYEEDKDLLARTNKILMIPDYLAYRLTGEMVGEVTN
ncbi:MAG: FGGY family carbohydrate kinase, partial [Trichococcus flocculiformis]